jgi:hypothetical protein
MARFGTEKVKTGRNVKLSCIAVRNDREVLYTALAMLAFAETATFNGCTRASVSSSSLMATVFLMCVVSPAL